jgi:hypothetical protein
MDDELESFEAELKRLQPVAPSHDLERRVKRELATTRGTSRAWWLAAATLPIAAAAALMISSPRHTTMPDGDKAIATTPRTNDVLKPVTAENVLYAASDEGLVTLADGTPARRERLEFVDTITWQNPRTHASLTWRLPREEVRVVPVVYQ